MIFYNLSKKDDTIHIILWYMKNSYRIIKLPEQDGEGRSSIQIVL